ncbi:phage holin family protein [Agrobacterium pusense]|uniref:phage holin family protein n=1 Tax=Agrobacterium pusense TaxID=648995 RepID=UPI000DDAE10A
MPEKYTSFIELVNAWLGGAFTTLFAALLGRFMWHGNEARKGRRKFFGFELFWELPVALGMAVIGESAASYLGLGQTASTGLIALLAYLGPRGVEALFHKWFDRRIAG